MTIDVIKSGFVFSRSEITRIFCTQVVSDHDHWFALLVAVPEVINKTSYLRLFVEQAEEAGDQSIWPVTVGAQAMSGFFQRNPEIHAWLQEKFDKSDASQLRVSVAAPGQFPMTLANVTSEEDHLDFVVDLCSVLDEIVFILVGRVKTRYRKLISLTASFGDEQLDLLVHGQCSFEFTSEEQVYNRQHFRGVEVNLVAVVLLPSSLRLTPDVRIEVVDDAAGLDVRRMLAANMQESRLEFLAKIATLDTEKALSLIESAAGELGNSNVERALADWLQFIHLGVVELLPTALDLEIAGVFFHCERVFAIDDNSIFLEGWFYFQDGIVANVSCSRGFSTIIVDSDWTCLSRPDVAEYLSTRGVATPDNNNGFSTYISFSAGSLPYVLSITMRSGKVHRMRVPAAVTLPTLQIIHNILTSFKANHRSLLSLLNRHVGPAVQKSWKRRHRHSKKITSDKFGEVPPDPVVSIIVPIYGRYDFAEYQLALFANDPDFQLLELIYFVDDPSIYDDFRSQCHDLYMTYGVPFRLSYGGSNSGFAGANNLAASRAEGRHLLFMNSDVLPKTPGWVSEMVNLYELLESPGLLGVKLLYEDGSVQHAGMKFTRHAPWGGLWINEHQYKGQSAIGLSGLHRADAVTAACALMNADLYRDLGGYSEDYIIGDFEDSDLCLKAAVAGRQNWLSLDIELYHLERQSQGRIGDAHWRSNLTLYNCWQHNQHWGDYLTKHYT